MDVYRVTRIESSTPVDKAASYISKSVSIADLTLPGANVTASRSEGTSTPHIVGEKAVELSNSIKMVPTSPASTYAKIRLDPDSHLISIEIFDAQTNEVIRQIPAEEIQKLARNPEVGTGSLVEKKQ